MVFSYLDLKRYDYSSFSNMAVYLVMKIVINNYIQFIRSSPSTFVLNALLILLQIAQKQYLKIHFQNRIAI